MVTRGFHMKICETYDLNTVVDKLSVLAIRTPDYDTIKRYISLDGLANWSKMKFDRCTFRIACASQLPVDPLGVGFEPGQVAPQDVINPMLFKTVTGESFNTIIQAVTAEPPDPNGDNTFDDDTGSIREMKLTQINGNDAVQLYYKFLADPSFRKVHPQSGMVAENLIPFVREVFSQYDISRLEGEGISVGTSGNYYSVMSPSAPSPGAPSGSLSPGLHVQPNIIAGGGRDVGMSTGLAMVRNPFMSGRSVPMPSFPTVNPQSGELAGLPKAYVGCLLMPPAKMQSLYYRCIVEWDISLYGFVPRFMRGWNGSANAEDGKALTHLYHDMYEVAVSSGTAEASALMETSGGVLEGIGVENLNYVNSSIA